MYICKIMIFLGGPSIYFKGNFSWTWNVDISCRSYWYMFTFLQCVCKLFTLALVYWRHPSYCTTSCSWQRPKQSRSPTAAPLTGRRRIPTSATWTRIPCCPELCSTFWTTRRQPSGGKTLNKCPISHSVASGNERTCICSLDLFVALWYPLQCHHGYHRPMLFQVDIKSLPYLPCVGIDP